MLEKTNSKIFTSLLGLSAVLVAAAAAIFSVTGLSMLYSGEMLYVAIAMGVLEFAKIVTASYLYRYWKLTGWGLKTYLSIAVLVLMLVTSGGIYGYLTNSYQGATIGLDKINSQTLVLEQRKINLTDERERLKGDIATLRAERQSTVENRNNEIAANNMAVDSNSVKYRTWRNSQVHKRYNEELKRIDDNVSNYTTNLDSATTRLSRINNDIADKSLEMIDTGVDVGPLVYMARIFNTTMDTVMKWFTLIIVFVFDPLAIALIVAYNAVIMRGKSEKQYKIGVDKAKPGDYSATYIPFDLKDATLTPPTGSTEWWKDDPFMRARMEDADRVLKEKKEDETFDLGEPDDLTGVTFDGVNFPTGTIVGIPDGVVSRTTIIKDKPDGYDDYHTWKPVEQAFDDIKEKIEEKKEKEYIETHHTVIKEIDDEIEEMEGEVEKKHLVGKQQELFDQDDEVKTRYAEKIIKSEMEYPPKLADDFVEEIKEKPTKEIIVDLDEAFSEALDETTKKVGREEPTKDRLGVKDSKEIAHANEFFDKMREEKKSPVTAEEIRNYFDDAVRKVKKEGQGKITRTPFQAGGNVNVGHIEDDPDTDYSIQE